MAMVYVPAGRAVMALRNASGEAMVRDGFLALADAEDRHVAVVEDAAEDALVDVDALDLVEAHLKRLPLDKAGLVDDAQIGDVGLGGPAMEPGGYRPVQRGDGETAANDRHNSTSTSVADHARQHQEDDCHNPGDDRRQEEYPVRVGRIQHLLAGLQDFVDITPHTPALN